MEAMASRWRGRVGARRGGRRGERARAVCGEGGVEGGGAVRESTTEENQRTVVRGRLRELRGWWRGVQRLAGATVEAKRGRAAAAAARATMRMCGTVRGTLHARTE